MLDKLKNKHLLFDGAMGTMLQLAGLKAGQLPEAYNINKPEIILNIHKKYLDSGADIITTNTFGANRHKLKDSPFSVDEVIKSGVEIAKKAIGDRKDKYVALDIGSIGVLLAPLGTLSFEAAYEIFKEQVISGVEAGVDLILIETMSDLYETKAAILAAKENSDKPVFCTMTFQNNLRTFTGTDVLTMVSVIEGLGVDVLGVNCSMGPKGLQPIVDEVLKYSSIPVMVQPNAGMPQILHGHMHYDTSIEEFSDQVEIMAEKGVAIFGGCCGTTPEYIKSIRSRLSGQEPVATRPKKTTSTSSASQTVIFGDNIKIIGEKINPTGKEKLKEALKNNNIDYLIREAIIQNETGADILDINLGLPGIDEKEMMLKVISELQGVVSLPLQIDSANTDVIEAAARIYNGKPIINSVNGKRDSMDKILPIVKKYGALVIGLTLDEDGIPATAEKRLEIASKIIENAKEYGIPQENVLIDPLVLTASAEQENVLETLKAIPLIKSKYNVKIVLGTSNISFGLPNRKILNTTYLAMALGYGLDAPITDTTNEALMDTIRSFRVLANQDKGSREYVSVYSNIKLKQAISTRRSKDSLGDIIIKGLKDEAKKVTEDLLNTHSSLEIVNTFMIPALDIVGNKYEAEEIFLPQLIRSAETAKKAFEAISDKLRKEGFEKTYKGKIILATVLGDIHDIGKNIVKLILENYGYDVIDLGKDVAIEEIVSAAKKENIKLIGLSALMTTTVSNMEETIRALRKEGLDTKVVVGGAVLTPEYSKTIGADFYAKDPREMVDIAKEIFDH